MLNIDIKPKIYTKEQAALKAEGYCVYQERSQQEVRNKLYEWGLHQSDTEQIITKLIENNFINEERFALAFTLGKFRIKGWGKLKIKQALKQKKVIDKLIHKSLSKIDDEDYLNKLLQILTKKSALLQEKDAFKKHYKLTQFAAYKGFERDLIIDLLKDNHLA
ncbi:MAG: RecX family transcriptional regulator [Flavobacterium sp.]|nr:RecX family transcriptional regulator [Pedobacter sp.]